MIATTWGTGQVAYSILWFFLLFIEIWLAISVFVDIFRSHDMKGSVKALWIIFVVVIPLFGILAYLILRGDRMRVHQVQAVQDQERMARSYMQRVSGSGQTAAEEILKLAELKNKGEITEAEFEQLKAHVISHSEREHSSAGGS
jgi:hypothetical protein